MATEIQLGKVRVYGSLSGYSYLHLPQLICKQFNVSRNTIFAIKYKDGKLVLEQSNDAVKE